MRNLAVFEPVEGGERLAGLCAELLANLNDIVLKFGLDHPASQLRRLRFDEPRTFFVSAGTIPGKRFMMVSTDAGHINIGTAHLILLNDDNHSPVLWDPLISCADVRTGIAAVDAAMRERGLIDPATGERRRLESEERAARLAVDEVFSRPYRPVPFKKLGASTAEALAMFDRPDEVAVIKETADRLILCRAAEADVIRWRLQAFKVIFAKYGIKRQSDVGQLPPERQRAFVAEIQAILDPPKN